MSCQIKAAALEEKTASDVDALFAVKVRAPCFLLWQCADVASVVAFLASDDARRITGDTIRVDGGSKL